MLEKFKTVFVGTCNRCGTPIRNTHPSHGVCCVWGGCNGIAKSFTLTGEDITPEQLKRAVLSGVRYDLKHWGFFACGFESHLGIALIVHARYDAENGNLLFPRSAAELFNAGKEFNNHTLLRIESDLFFDNGPTYYVVAESKTVESFWNKACTLFNVNSDFKRHVLGIINDAVRHR